MIIDIIRTIAKMSVEGIVIIAIILGLRALFKALHISYKFIVPLWVIVFFYLVFPFKIPVENGFWKDNTIDKSAEEQFLEKEYWHKNTDISMLEEGNELNDYSLNIAIDKSGEIVNDDQNNMLMQAVDAINEYSDRVLSNNNEEIGRLRLIKPEHTLEYIWIIVFAVFFIKMIFSYFSLRKKLDESIPENKNVFLSDNIESPMVFGIMSPRVYMPFSMDGENRDFVVAHENMHIKRKDNVIKLMAHIIKLIHWFNPFVWIAYRFLSEDIERACDEAVVSTLDEADKKKYASALLNIALEEKKRRHTIFEAPVLFDEGNLKGRVNNIMKFKKTLLGLGIFAVCAVAGVGILFSTKDKAVTTDVTEPVEIEANDNNEEIKDEIVAIVDENVDASNDEASNKDILLMNNSGEYLINDDYYTIISKEMVNGENIRIVSIETNDYVNEAGVKSAIILGGDEADKNLRIYNVKTSEPCAYAIIVTRKNNTESMDDYIKELNDSNTNVSIFFDKVDEDYYMTIMPKEYFDKEKERITESGYYSDKIKDVISYRGFKDAIVNAEYEGNVESVKLEVDTDKISKLDTFTAVVWEFTATFADEYQAIMKVPSSERKLSIKIIDSKTKEELKSIDGFDFLELMKKEAQNIVTTSEIAKTGDIIINEDENGKSESYIIIRQVGENGEPEVVKMALDGTQEEYKFKGEGFDGEVFEIVLERDENGNVIVKEK